jgi:hypothetical protein
MRVHSATESQGIELSTTFSLFSLSSPLSRRTPHLALYHWLQRTSTLSPLTFFRHRPSRSTSLVQPTIQSGSFSCHHSYPPPNFFQRVHRLVHHLLDSPLQVYFRDATCTGKHKLVLPLRQRVHVCSISLHVLPLPESYCKLAKVVGS